MSACTRGLTCDLKKRGRKCLPHLSLPPFALLVSVCARSSDGRRRPVHTRPLVVLRTAERPSSTGGLTSARLSGCFLLAACARARVLALHVTATWAFGSFHLRWRLAQCQPPTKPVRLASLAPPRYGCSSSKTTTEGNWTDKTRHVVHLPDSRSYSVLLARVSATAAWRPSHAMWPCPAESFTVQDLCRSEVCGSRSFGVFWFWSSFFLGKGGFFTRRACARGPCWAPRASSRGVLIF